MTEEDETYYVWPDGTIADVDEVWDGHYDWKSDDYHCGTLEEAVALGYITEEVRLEYEEVPLFAADGSLIRPALANELYSVIRKLDCLTSCQEHHQEILAWAKDDLLEIINQLYPST